MRNRSGPPVSGPDFAFREREVETVKAALADGSGVLLFGLRRIGKTSLLMEVKRRLDASGAAHCIMIDVQDRKSLSEFYLQVLSALPRDLWVQMRVWLHRTRRIPSSIARIIGGATKRGSIAGATIEFNEKVSDYWSPLADAIEMATKGASLPVVILIDELPFFIENLRASGASVADIRQLLSTLRAWRNAGVGMAIAGSLSIDLLLDELEISSLTLNDVSRLELKPLLNDEARGLMQKLFAGAGIQPWPSATQDYVLSKLDDLFPFFIQCAFRHLRLSPNPTTDEIDKVFEDDVYPDIRRAFFQQFDDRLSRYFTRTERTTLSQILSAMLHDKSDAITTTAFHQFCDKHTVEPATFIKKLELQQFLMRSQGVLGIRCPIKLILAWHAQNGG